MHLQDLQFLILLFSNLYIVYLIITSYTPGTAKHFLRAFGFGKHSKNLATAAFCCVFTNVFVNSAHSQQEVHHLPEVYINYKGTWVTCEHVIHSLALSFLRHTEMVAP